MKYRKLIEKCGNNASVYKNAWYNASKKAKRQLVASVSNDANLISQEVRK